MKYLYAAYFITWGVILAYVIVMIAGFRKVQQEMRDLER